LLRSDLVKADATGWRHVAIAENQAASGSETVSSSNKAYAQSLSKRPCASLSIAPLDLAPEDGIQQLGNAIFEINCVLLKTDFGISS